MEFVRRFWTQRSTQYRNFQIAFVLLFVSVALAAGGCLFAPAFVLEQIASINIWLGGARDAITTSHTTVWRYLGTAHAVAMAFMCWWLLRDLRNRRSVLAPLVFLAGTAGMLCLAGYLQLAGYPVLLAAAVGAFASCAVVVVFATVAWADIQGRSDGVLVPAPVGTSPLGWTH
ncbi:MAG: hypothetical protein ABEK29_04680, partial [Bradymonadaceae bacterium]